MGLSTAFFFTSRFIALYNKSNQKIKILKSRFYLLKIIININKIILFQL